MSEDYVRTFTTEYEDHVFLRVLIGSIHFVGEGGPGGFNQGLLRLCKLRMETPVEPIIK